MTTRLTLPHWYDLHAHFRQDAILPVTVTDHIAMGCAGFLAMPNTKPPLTRVFTSEETPQAGSIETYLSALKTHCTDQIKDIIVPLYLCAGTTPAMIEAGAKSGLLRAAKYYPPHGTTGAEFGAPMDHYIDNGVLAAMEACGITLCIHGEEHALPAERYFDKGSSAEELFYTNRMPRLVDTFPSLKIVGEHLTTKAGVEFISQAPAHVKATVTPQHLLYTVGHLLQGLKYHLYCLPLVKFEEDRAALRTAITATDNSKFFAGTDSAPHTHKTTPCGCAAGCYTGGIAPQLYADAFERSGADLSTPAGESAFKAFLCDIGRDFYGLPTPSESFTLVKTPQSLHPVRIDDQHTITPLPLGIESGDGETGTLAWSIQV